MNYYEYCAIGKKCQGLTPSNLELIPLGITGFF